MIDLLIDVEKIKNIVYKSTISAYRIEVETDSRIKRTTILNLRNGEARFDRISLQTLIELQCLINQKGW